MPSPRLYPSLLLLACAVAMGTALTTQYVFGLPPCPLCIKQRIPYLVAAVLSLVAIKAEGRVRLLLVALCGVAFLVDSGIAVFHVGVEQHWWEAACVGGENPQAATVADLKALLAGPPPVPCDRVPWSVFGISMAGYNAMFAFGLALLSGWAVRQLKEGQ